MGEEMGGVRWVNEGSWRRNGHKAAVYINRCMSGFQLRLTSNVNGENLASGKGERENKGKLWPAKGFSSTLVVREKEAL